MSQTDSGPAIPPPAVPEVVRTAPPRPPTGQAAPQVGALVSGTVIRLLRGDAAIDLGGAVALLRRRDMLPADQPRPGVSVTALVCATDARAAPQTRLSRAHPEFLTALLARAVPEVAAGRIAVAAVARDPGWRSVVAVHAVDDAVVDPEAICRAALPTMAAELGNEEIAVLRWAEDPRRLVPALVAPVRPTVLRLDEDFGRMEIVVAPNPAANRLLPSRYLALIGTLLGWQLTVSVEEPGAPRPAAPARLRPATARGATGRKRAVRSPALPPLPIAALPGMSREAAVRLVGAGLDSAMAIAELAGWELREAVGDGLLSEEAANAMVMAARAATGEPVP